MNSRIVNPSLLTSAFRCGFAHSDRAMKSESQHLRQLPDCAVKLAQSLAEDRHADAQELAECAAILADPPRAKQARFEYDAWKPCA